MKIIQASYTFLVTLEVADDATPDEIEARLEDEAPANWYNDLEWQVVE